MKNLLWCFLALVVLAGLVACQGCTLHFKGKEVEMDAETTKIFYLEKADIFGGKTHFAKSAAPRGDVVSTWCLFAPGELGIVSAGRRR